MKEVVAIIKEHERPVKFYFRTTPSRSLSPDIIKQKMSRSLVPTPMHKRRMKTGKNTVTVTFGPGPMGLELCPRLKNGVMIKALTSGGAAENTQKLRKSMMLLSINSEDCSTSTLKQIMKSITSTSRPITMKFAEMKHVKLLEQKEDPSVKAANKLSAIVEVEYADGPIGLELVPRKRGGGTLVKSVQSDTQSSASGKIRKGMRLLYIGETDVSSSTMKEVVAIIKEHERPVKFYFRTTPSRSLSPDIIKQKLRSRFTPTPKTRIPKRVSEHFVSVVFGPGPMGMELVQRRKGGAMIKSISKGGAADQSGKLRRSMVLATVDNEDCTKLKLAEVLKKLSVAHRPVEIQFHELSSIDHRYDLKKMRKIESLISTTFQFKGSLGLELAQRKSGGVIVKKVLQTGLAAGSGKIRQSMVLVKINEIDVSKKTLVKVLSMLKSSDRPITLMWKSAPSRSVSPDAKEIRHQRWEEERAFKEFFDKIDKDSSGVVTKAELMAALQNNALKEELRKIVAEYSNLQSLLDLNNFTTSFDRIQASSNDGVTFQDLQNYVKKTNEMLQMSKSIRDVTTIFRGEGFLGLKLAQRKYGGVIVKDVLPGGLAIQTRKIRKAMVLKTINSENVSKKSLSEVLALLQSSARPLKLVWKCAPSRSISPYAREIKRVKMEEEKMIDEFFRSIDVDSSGFITKKEILRHLQDAENFESMISKYKNLKPLVKSKTYANTFKQIDVDNSKGISLGELKAFLKAVSTPPEDNEKGVGEMKETIVSKAVKKRGRIKLRQFFRKIDKDDSGSISKKELLQALQSCDIVSGIIPAFPNLKPLVKSRTYLQTFKNIDTDKSGDISFEELSYFVEHVQKRPGPKEMQFARHRLRQRRRVFNKLLPVEGKLESKSGNERHIRDPSSVELDSLKNEMLPSD
jgi:Ca2+-binding EF-hand superfamily protein